MLAVGVAVGLVAISWLGRALVVRPQRGVLVLAAIAPFDGLLVLVDDPGLLAGWKEALTLATLAATWWAPTRARRTERQPFPGYVVPLLGLFVLGLASLLWSPLAFTLFGLKVDFFYALIAVAIWRCPLDESDRDHLVTILMIGGLLTALVGLAQQRIGVFGLNDLGYEFDRSVRTTGNSVLRSFSTFELPFPFAFYLVLVLSIGLSVSLAAPNRRRNRLFLAASPILFVALLASFVRAGLVALAITGLYLLARRHRALIRIVPLALVALLAAPEAVWSATLSSTSLGERTDNWSATWATIVDRPLGSGIGTTGAAAERVADDDVEVPETFGLPPEQQPFQPDNYYLKRALELGLPGLWLTITFLHHVLASTLAIRRRAGPGDVPLIDGVIATLLGAIVAAVVATYWEIFPLDLYFWILLGALSSIESTGSSAARWPSGPAVAASRPTFASS